MKFVKTKFVKINEQQKHVAEILEKSAFTIWILIFSRFFAIFLDAQPTKSAENRGNVNFEEGFSDFRENKR